MSETSKLFECAEFKELDKDDQMTEVFETYLGDNSNDSTELHEFIDQFFDTEAAPQVPPQLAPRKENGGGAAQQRQAKTRQLDEPGGGWREESREQYQKTWNERKEIRTRVDTSIRMVLDQHIYRKLAITPDDFDHDLRKIDFDKVILREEILTVFREIPGIDSFKNYEFTTISQLIEDVSELCIGPKGYQRKTKRPYRKTGAYVGAHGAKPRRKRNATGKLVENTNVPIAKVKKARGRPKKY